MDIFITFTLPSDTHCVLDGNGIHNILLPSGFAAALVSGVADICCSGYFCNINQRSQGGRRHIQWNLGKVMGEDKFFVHCISVSFCFAFPDCKICRLDNQPEEKAAQSLERTEQSLIKDTQDCFGALQKKKSG